MGKEEFPNLGGPPDHLRRRFERETDKPGGDVHEADTAEEQEPDLPSWTRTPDDDIRPIRAKTLEELAIRPNRLFSWLKGASTHPDSTFKVRIESMRLRAGFISRMVTLLVINVLVVFASISLNPKVSFVLVLVVLVADYLIVRALIDKALDLPYSRPANKLVPMEGRPKWHYRLNCLYGRPDKVPNLTVGEMRVRRREHLEVRWIELFQLGVHPKTWIANSSGKNGKSLMAVVLTSIYGRLSGMPCYLIPAMANAQTGTAGKLTGLKGKSASMRVLVEKIRSKSLTTARQLRMVVFGTRDRAFVISEDPEGDAHGRYFGNGMLRDVANFIFTEESSTGTFDTGNDGAHQNSVTVEALVLANGAIFTAWSENPQGVDKLHEALGEYWRFGKEFLKQSTTRTPVNPEDISFQEMIEEALVVFHAIDPQTDLEHFRQHVHIGADHRAEFRGRIMFVRFDPYLRTLLEGFDLDKMHPDTYNDYMSIAVAEIEQVAAHLRIEVPPRHPFIENDFGLSLAPKKA